MGESGKWGNDGCHVEPNREQTEAHTAAAVSRTIFLKQGEGMRWFQPEEHRPCSAKDYLRVRSPRQEEGSVLRCSG